jgi:hypothetical protein
LDKKVKEFVDITPSQKGKGNGHASKKLPKDTDILSKKNNDVNVQTVSFLFISQQSLPDLVRQPSFV